MDKTITARLSNEDLRHAIREVQKYKMHIERKTEELRQRVSTLIAMDVLQGFRSSVSDTMIRGASIPANVQVDIDDKDNVSIVMAIGEDAIWAEFGAGVYYNGNLGSSPHPKGAELGFTIGGYGKGNGRKQTWGYRDEEGNLILTHGTPASMPMYKACQRIAEEIDIIAREVFG